MALLSLTIFVSCILATAMLEAEMAGVLVVAVNLQTGYPASGKH